MSIIAQYVQSVTEFCKSGVNESQSIQLFLLVLCYEGSTNLKHCRFRPKITCKLKKKFDRESNHSQF